MKEKVEKICKYDMNVFVNRQLIYNYPEQVNTYCVIFMKHKLWHFSYLLIVV